MIDWQSFSWEAFATLMTGLAAIAAATVVAWKQVRIVDRQVALQELALKHEMFDRRIERVYKPIDEVLTKFMSVGEELEPGLSQKFAEAAIWSAMLFQDSVSDELSAILSALNEIEFENAKSKDEKLPLSERERYRSDVVMKRIGVLGISAQLRDILGDSLKLE